MRTPGSDGMQVALAVDNDVKAARIVKGRLEKTTLGQVAHHIRLVFKPGGGLGTGRGLGMGRERGWGQGDRA